MIQYSLFLTQNSHIAYRSSQYLQSLLDHDVIVPEASKPLDEVYKLYPATPSSFSSHSDFNSDSTSESHSSEPSRPTTDPEREPQHKLLLGPEAIPAILSLFELEATSTNVDLGRAMEQARLRVSNGRIGL